MAEAKPPKKLQEPQQSQQLHCVEVTAPARHGLQLEELMLQFFPAGFEQRAQGRQVCFVGYVPSAPQLRRISRGIERAVSTLVSQTTGRKEVTVRASSIQSDWQTRWIAELGPQRLTASKRVIAVAAAPAPGARGHGKVRELYLLQRAAFGFGEHPTTRLVARELERRLRGKRSAGKSVLDVGTGTGVLAIAAALDGATKALGIDIDTPSVAAARGNARLNGVTRRCTFRAQPLARVKGRFDLVLANLDFATLCTLAKALRRTLSEQGVLLVSGVLAESEPALTALFAELGLKPCHRSQEDDWVALGYTTRARSA